MRRALIGLLLVLAATRVAQAQCTVSPSSINFGSRIVGASDSQIVTVGVAVGFNAAENFSFSATPGFTVSPSTVTQTAHSSSMQTEN